MLEVNIPTVSVWCRRKFSSFGMHRRLVALFPPTNSYSVMKHLMAFDNSAARALNQRVLGHFL